MHVYICLWFVVSIVPCSRRELFAGRVWGEGVGGVGAEGCCAGGCGLCRCWVPPCARADGVRMPSVSPQPGTAGRVSAFACAGAVLCVCVCVCARKCTGEVTAEQRMRSSQILTSQRFISALKNRAWALLLWLWWESGWVFPSQRLHRASWGQRSAPALRSHLPWEFAPGCLQRAGYPRGLSFSWLRSIYLLTGAAPSGSNTHLLAQRCGRAPACIPIADLPQYTPVPSASLLLGALCLLSCRPLWVTPWQCRAPRHLLTIAHRFEGLLVLTSELRSGELSTGSST